MNKIDEIALRVAAEIGAVSYSPPPFRAVRGYSFTYDDLWRFTRALVADPELLAELSKEAAPVIASEQKPVAWVDVIDRHEGPYNFNGLELLDSGKHLLFTTPPDTADIEQRVAEACAKYCDNLKTYHVETGRPILASVAEHAAHYLRGGKWREYL